MDVPLAHMPDHTWLGMSEEEWAVNLEMYATQPERFLQLQCEGECWCNPPDARAHSWAGHGRGPTACRFETRPFDEGLGRALAVARQSQSAGANLPINDPMLMLEVVAALAHYPGWCTCLPSMLTRLDEVPEYLSRGWSFDTFPGADPAIEPVRTWIDGAFTPGKGLFVWGGVGRGKTGLAVAAAREYLAVDPERTAFFGRVTTVTRGVGGRDWHGAGGVAGRGRSAHPGRSRLWVELDQPWGSRHWVHSTSNQIKIRPAASHDLDRLSPAP